MNREQGMMYLSVEMMMYLSVVGRMYLSVEIEELTSFPLSPVSPGSPFGPGRLYRKKLHVL